MVQGLAELRRRWSAVPAKVREAVKDELEGIATSLVADMQRVARRGATLKLVNSIGWTWGAAPKGTMVVGTVGASEGSRLRITIYAGGGDAFYARFQEFGTVKMAANPFFFPVWRARRRSVKSKISRAISKAVKAA